VSSPPADGRAGRAPAWSPEDDVPLVLAAQAGESASFDALYRRHARVVRAVLLGRANREDVDDLIQEVFLAAWRQLGSLRDPAAFAGWVMTIARHQRIDHARRRRDHATLEDAAGRLPVTSPSATAGVEAARALAAVRVLPVAYRETLLLRLVEGMSGPEIAARTGLTPESVRVNLCRGMKMLRETLDVSPGLAAVERASDRRTANGSAGDVVAGRWPTPKVGR